jgi:hypothetical protein
MKRRKGRAMARVSFLSRLIFLKMLAFIAFVFMALYTPSTTNHLLDRAGSVSLVMARGVDDLLQYLGAKFGDVSSFMPRKGSVELAFRFFNLEKVVLFIGIIIAMYIAWMLLTSLVSLATRKSGVNQAPRDPVGARLQIEPPR